MDFDSAFVICCCEQAFVVEMEGIVGNFFRPTLDLRVSRVVAADPPGSSNEQREKLGCRTKEDQLALDTLPQRVSKKHYSV